MEELINNKTLGYGGKIFATINAFDVMRYIDGRNDDTRILYDPRIDTWFIGEAGDYTHANFVIEGWRNGYYSDYDFKTEDDVINYYCNNTFLWLYFYKDLPYKPNLTGDYKVHYVYDFGILDSQDITKNANIFFEDTELYKILLPRLINTVKEETRRQ